MIWLKNNWLSKGKGRITFLLVNTITSIGEIVLKRAPEDWFGKEISSGFKGRAYAGETTRREKIKNKILLIRNFCNITIANSIV